MKPVIGITMGDPAGIGPEILLKSIFLRKLPKNIDYKIYGDYAYLEKSWKYFIRGNRSFKNYFKNTPIIDYHTLAKRRLFFGRATKEGGYASGQYIEGAIKAALNHEIDGIVTLPINKEAFWLGGWGKKYPGHTDMLADLSGVKKYALMLVCGPLRAIHVTAHISLKDVPHRLTTKKVADTISLAILGCHMLGIRNPRVAVCGLNPHAGEGGILGTEEKEIIAPAIRQFKESQFKIEGPFPADIVWPKVLGGEYDIGVAMYHDQGQIPLKMMGFHVRTNKKWTVEGVNVTVGLPFVRTSVMHGTAFDLAGKGFASEKSLICAIDTAVSILK